MTNSKLGQEVWEADTGGALHAAPPVSAGPLERFEGAATAVIASAWMLFHVYTTWQGNLPLMQHLAVVVAFSFSLVFVWHPLHRSEQTGRRPGWAMAVDVVLTLAALTASIYLVINFQAIQEQATFSTTNLTVAIVLTLMIMEGCRRTLGLALPVIAAAAIAFAYYGGDLGPFSHRAFTTERIFSVLALSRAGIFTAPMAIVGTFLALYMLLAAIMQVSGTGEFFVNAAKSLFGHMRGGTAKVATSSSALFGMISGAGVANAATTGPFTIPMMKSAGYTAQNAAAFEAVASIGGQLMPPIMGAAAFMIASFIGVSYADVIKAAFIPAVLYYLALWWFISIQSRKRGMIPGSKEDMPKFWDVLKSHGYHILPVVVLLWALMVQNLSPARSGLYAVVAAALVSQVRAESRLSPGDFVDVLVAGARMTLPLVMAVGCVGVVVGVVSMSGVGIKLSGIMIGAAGSSLFLLLLFTMLASLVLGTGLPTTPTYLFLAVVVAPALGDAGIGLMAAHLFILYYGVLSDVTPPLAVAPFVAAGIAGSDPWKTTWTVLRVALAAWFLPFMFVYSPSLLMDGTPLHIALSVARAGLGIFLLTGALQRFIFRPLNLSETALSVLGFGLLIAPTLWLDVVGISIFVLVVGRQVAWQRANGDYVPDDPIGVVT